MSDATPQQRLMQRWQQGEDEELLIEPEWIADQIAKAVEHEARLAMNAMHQEESTP